MIHSGQDFIYGLLLSMLALSVFVSALFSLSAKINFNRTRRIRREVESRWCTPCPFCKRGSTAFITSNNGRIHMRYVGGGQWKVLHNGDASFITTPHCPNCGRSTEDDKP